jgi:hypothetical protein
MVGEGAPRIAPGWLSSAILARRPPVTSAPGRLREQGSLVERGRFEAVTPRAQLEVGSAKALVELVLVGLSTIPG